jgi:hypothetical protein
MKTRVWIFLSCFLLFSCKEKESPQVIYNTINNFGIITGKITTITGDTAVAGAMVKTSPAFKTVYTDSSGKYSIPDVAPGYYTVIASKPGYASDSATVSIVDWRTVSVNLSISYISVPPLFDFTGYWTGWINSDSVVMPMTLNLQQIREDSIKGTMTVRYPGIPWPFPPDSIPVNSTLIIENDFFRFDLYAGTGMCFGYLSGNILDMNTVSGEFYKHCINDPPVTYPFSAQRAR